MGTSAVGGPSVMLRFFSGGSSPCLASPTPTLSSYTSTLARRGCWSTRFRKKFQAEGFPVPEVVFWKVGTSKAYVLVVAAQAGVELVSGYSKNLVRLFLEADGVLTPSAVRTQELF